MPGNSEENINSKHAAQPRPLQPSRAAEASASLRKFERFLIDAEKPEGARDTPKMNIGQGKPRGCKHLRADVAALTGHRFRSRTNNKA